MELTGWQELRKKTCLWLDDNCQDLKGDFLSFLSAQTVWLFFLVYVLSREMRTSHERRLNLNTWMSSLSGHPSLMSLCVYQTIVSGSLVCVSEMKLPVSLFLTPLLSGNQPRDRRLGFRPAGFSAAIPVLFLTSAIDLLAEEGDD